MKAKLYCIKKFAEQFNLHISLCYAIPAIFGNDFWKPLSKGTIKRICQHDIKDNSTKQIQKVCTALGELYCSLKKCMAMGDDVREACHRTKNLYSVGKTFDVEYLMEPKNSLLRHHSGAELPDWFITAYRSGYIPPYIVEATISQITILPDMIDDIGQKTSTSLSDPIRQCLYAILNCI
jgi:hypothetical protein